MAARAKRKTPEQQATRLSRRLLPEVQARRGGFTVVDVANHSEADQRHMIRSQERKTIRRTTKLEILQRQGMISLDDQKACEWYAENYALGYDTLGITANYGESGGGGDGVIGHLARYKAQAEARRDYEWAKAAIDPLLVSLFERVVLHGRPMGRLRLSFERAVRQLRSRVDQVIPAT